MSEHSQPTRTGLGGDAGTPGASFPSTEEGRFPAGTTLAGRFRILGLLGKGGMGEVYRAHDLALNQPVALKFIAVGAHKDEAALARFRNEVRIARQVSHPNVCRVYDIGVIEGQHFLSMEYVDGEDLASLLRRIGRLPSDKALEFTRRICAGLAAAHERGVLHRDLKPANIMIDGRGQVRITDFGLAALVGDVHGGDIRSGTPAYMSPEQKAGREVTTRSDLYSLGLVLHEMFTGRRPGDSQTTPTALVKDLDPAIERVILRCLEVDPRSRPSSALNVAMALPGGDPIAAALAAGETPPSPGKGAVQGNLPAESSSFVGREAEVAELLKLVDAHRLVTLTGVGGVGKTRLALEVARQLGSGFFDGAWLVELAPVSDPAAVPHTAATALGITPQASRSIAQAIADALSGRRLLIVLDNCEHVLDAAADLVETLLARTEGVRIIATSREGLRVGAEHLWPLPSLDTRAGVASAAVQLFVARAQAVKGGFTLANPTDADAVTAICQRLDGIALAIELAAARMVSMNPTELLARLTDRFRLLSGSRRGLERHQTLRHAVQWSYDLLTDDEKALLDRCSVFAGGFDLQAADRVCGGDGPDEYALLNLLDSLVRKSLVTAEQFAGKTRFGMLETIRQFAEERMAAAGGSDEVRDHHARYFAMQAVVHWATFISPQQREAIDWADVEYANLRAGFRWAADKGELDTAADIAAHTACVCSELNRYEPTRWVEEILPAATRADIRRLPRLLVAATLAAYAGRREAVPAYCRQALHLQDDPRYDPFDPGWGVLVAGLVQILVSEGGAAEESLVVFRELSSRPGLAGAAGLIGLLIALTANGRAAEAREMAEDAVTAARAHGIPHFLCWAEFGLARAHMESDHGLAQRALQSARSRAREHRLEPAENRCLRETAVLEALGGDVPRSLVSFDRVIDAEQRAGNQVGLRAALANLAVLCARMARPEVAATLIGASPTAIAPVGLPAARTYLRQALGKEGFAACEAAGAAMEFPAAAVRYAREQIALAQRDLTAETAAP